MKIKIEWSYPSKTIPGRRVCYYYSGSVDRINWQGMLDDISKLPYKEKGFKLDISTKED